MRPGSLRQADRQKLSWGASVWIIFTSRLRDVRSPMFSLSMVWLTTCTSDIILDSQPACKGCDVIADSISASVAKCT